MPTNSHGLRSFLFWIKKSEAPLQHTNTYFTDGMRYVHNNLIGQHAMTAGPFGERRLTYANYAETGRSLYMIENYLAKYVYSYHCNAHTAASFSSLQTNKFKGDAKTIIRHCCNASDEDFVIFCNRSVATAIYKVTCILGMTDLVVAKSTIVFISSSEHHSNILTWKDMGATIVRIGEDSKGQLDGTALEHELKRRELDSFKLKVGAFSACSNITGLLTDTTKISQIMHKYGGLVFWDYTAGAPYLDIDMNPEATASHKDIIFCSPHTFVGGPGSSGVLIAKKNLFGKHRSYSTGSGADVYVMTKHSYIKAIETQETDTTLTIESIRAGLAFQLKSSIGANNILKREEYLAKKGVKALRKNPNITLLGNKVSPRAPILSFCIKHTPTKKTLHYNYVALLLNELFGIQAKGVCCCDEPYVQELLSLTEEGRHGLKTLLDDDTRDDSVVVLKGVNDSLSSEMRRAKSLPIMKPGFVCINLAYFMPDDEVNFILKAINMVADEAWKLLPQYSYNVERGTWQHKYNKKRQNQLMSLLDISYERTSNFSMTVQGTINPKSSYAKQQSFSYIIQEAEKIFSTAATIGKSLYPDDEPSLAKYLPQSLLCYVWWLEPQYALSLLNVKSLKSLEKILAKPREVSGSVYDSPASSRSRLPRINQSDVKSMNCGVMVDVNQNVPMNSGMKPDEKTSRKHDSEMTIKAQRTREWVAESNKWRIEKKSKTHSQHKHSSSSKQRTSTHQEGAQHNRVITQEVDKHPSDQNRN